MKNLTTDADGNLRRIYAHSNLLDVLVEIEKVLDNLDIYVFDGWESAEIIAGPEFRRYWVDVALMFESRPDTKCLNRLIQHGIGVKKKMLKKKTAKVDDKGKQSTELKKVFVIILNVPRHLLSDLSIDPIYIDADEVIDGDDIVDTKEFFGDEL